MEKLGDLCNAGLQQVLLIDNHEIHLQKNQALSKLSFWKRSLHPLQNSIYHLATNHRDSATGVTKTTGGTAVYIGNALFLTAAHCCKKDSRFDEFNLYLAHKAGTVNTATLGSKKVSGFLEVEPAGYLDPNLIPHLPIPPGYVILKRMDLALLRMISGNIPDNSKAALPGSPRSPHFEAVFVGVNGYTVADPRLLESYPQTISKKQVLKAGKDLKPHKVSTATGQASFADVTRRPGSFADVLVKNQDEDFSILQRGRSSDADIIIYKISTAPGSSGSAISQLDCKFVYGIHVAAWTTTVLNNEGVPKQKVTPRSVAGAVNLNTALFKGFARTNILPTMLGTDLGFIWQSFVGPGNAMAIENRGSTMRPVAEEREIEVSEGELGTWIDE